MDKKRKKLSRNEVKETIPVLKEFNKLSKAFIQLLGQKVEKREKQVSQIKVMVSGITKPETESQLVNVQAVTVKKSSSGFWKKPIKDSDQPTWEDEFKKNKGGIIL